MTHILVVDDEPDIRGLLRDILEDEGYAVSLACNGSEAREARRERRPDLILLDIWMPDIDGISLLKEWLDGGPAQDIPVVMMSGHGTVETAVEATRLGAHDFIEKPLSTGKLLVTVSRALSSAELARENAGLRARMAVDMPSMSGSRSMQPVLEQAKRMALHHAPVFITGESGTGKEVLARFIHEHSERRDGPFTTVNVAALARENPELQLLGSEEGGRTHYGSIEKSNGGTVFIKDVADMDAALQAQLEQAMETRTIVRVGGTEPVPVDVRFIIATRKDLAAEVAQGRFRDDLFYQLNVLPLSLPPLSERGDEIAMLADHFLSQFADNAGLPRRELSQAARQRLSEHDWPGNVRELKNLMQRLMIMGGDPVIGEQEIAGALGLRRVSNLPTGEQGFDLPLREAREQFERAYLEYQLKKLGGSVSKVAEQVGIERTHLYRKLRTLNIDPKQLKESNGK